MKRKIIVIGVAVACVVILGLGIFAYSHKVHAPEIVDGVAKGAPPPYSLKELLYKGETQQCTFSQSVAGVFRTGVVYMTGGMMRGDFAVQGGARSAHMITDGYEARFWSDSDTEGITIKYRDEKPVPQPLTTIDLYARSEYTCEQWAVDTTLFQPPSNVTFKNADEVFSPQRKSEIMDSLTATTTEQENAEESTGSTASSTLPPEVL